MARFTGLPNNNIRDGCSRVVLVRFVRIIAEMVSGEDSSSLNPSWVKV